VSPDHPVNSVHSASTNLGPSPVFGRPSTASELPWVLTRRGAGMAGIRADSADTDWCALRVASVVGVRHRLAATGVQDSWAWDGDDDRVVLAVADGLGSYGDSGPVAATVVATAVAALAGGATDLLGALEAANLAVSGFEEGKSTIVLATVSRDGNAELLRVGDSTAFTLSGEVWTELFSGEDDEMRSPATAAIPSAEPEIQRARYDLQPGEVLVLLTDGVGDPLRDGPTTVAPGLAAALASPPHPLVLAAQADFSRQGCGDDRTLLGVWFGAGAVTP
jgi:serine/threonine protein phosphatase PrpC